jgi:hypothetical protein
MRPPESRLLRRLSACWPMLFPLAMLLPTLLDFPFPTSDGSFSDLAISHYPAAITLKQLLVEYRQVPLWSPHLLGGAPLAANPLYSLYYPPAWLALVLPLPAGFNLLVILHIGWGALGVYRLLRAEGLRREAAALGALGYAALPKLYAHYGAGHLTLLYAVPWTPWLLLAWRQGGFEIGRGWLRLRAGAGFILGVIFLADPRWAAYAGLLWLGYALYSLKELETTRERLRNLPKIVIQLLVALLISAPLAWPLLEFTRLSTRAQLTPAENLVFSLPPARLLGLLFPSLGAAHEFELYPGTVIILLAVLAVFWGKVRQPAGFWLAAALLSLAWSLGDNLPAIVWLAHLPGFDLLRVPPRALFITGLSQAALAAYAIHHLWGGQSLPDLPLNPARRRLGLPLAALALFGVLLAGATWVLTSQFIPSLAWGAALLAIGALWIGLRLAGRMQPRLWFLGLVVVCVLDFGVVDQMLFAARPSEEVLSEKSALVQYLEQQSGPFRVYSPSYSLPQQVSAPAGLEHVDGIDPLQVKNYVDFVSQAAGTPFAGYSVTLPSFGAGDLALDNRNAVIDAGHLGQLNVMYVAAEYPIYSPGLEWVGEFAGTQLYRNSLALPRVWLQPLTSPLGEDIQPVANLEWTPNHNRVDLGTPLNAPAWIVFSEIAYPGWRAYVNGQAATLDAAQGLLRAVHLQAGAQVVELRFQPSSIYGGLGLGLLGLALVMLLTRWTV